MSKNTQRKTVSDRNKILTEAQRCINLAIANIHPENTSVDRNAVLLDLNAAYGLIQTVKGM